ncbi:MAG: hypothetical protein JXA25_20335 [Anaerolineales bacterium]|nr:hypothetical protein [Anaerolineales bacterium]
MPGFIHSVIHPAVYHGHRKQSPFFEGWYYKLVSADGTDRVAIIPAVILGEDGHAFIQILDGNQARMGYHPFSLTDFKAAKERFEVQIAENFFDLSGFSLNLDSNAGLASGTIQITDLTPWPVTLASPGVMGWYAWVPAMECYHGVLSFDHKLSGTLTLNDRVVDFNGGRGYLEKDWGASFPEGYVWMQTNHFLQQGVSLMASVAVIPWRRSAFPGFIIGLWQGGRLWRFATYTGAKLETLEITEDYVLIGVQNRRRRLQLQADRVKGVALRGPTKANMGLRVDESLAGTVAIRLSTLGGEVLFEGTGMHAGLEVVQPERLLHWIKGERK